MYHCKIYFTNDWWPWRRELELENDTEKHSIGRDEWTIGKKERVDERLSDCFTINRPLYTMSYFPFPSPFRQRPLYHWIRSRIQLLSSLDKRTYILVFNLSHRSAIAPFGISLETSGLLIVQVIRSTVQWNRIERCWKWEGFREPARSRMVWKIWRSI